MCKKLNLLLVLAIIVAILFVLSSVSQAAEILFVHAQSASNLRGSDQQIVDFLKGLGHNLTLREVSSAEQKPNVTEADGKDLVILSESLSSGNIADAFKDSETPIVCFESWILDDMLMTGSVSGMDFGSVTTGATQIAILDPTHPLAR